MPSLTMRLGFRAIKGGARIPKPALFQKFMDNGYLADLLDRLRVDCAMDVGANKGQYANKLRSIGYDGVILSFEPIREDYEHLLKISADDPKWHIYNIALGSSEETKEFHVIDGGGFTVFSSFLAPLEGGEAGHLAVQPMPVTVRTIDSIFAEIAAIVPNPRIFLKMDTQGYDLEVFKGAVGSVSSVVGLQSELSVEALYADQPTYTQALEIYSDAGFSLMNLSIVRRSRTSGVLEYDCIMARPGELGV